MHRIQSNEIRDLERTFSGHKRLLEQVKEDFDERSGRRIYSVDFAVLFPYLVPVALQPNEDDPLYYISNNIFLLINDRIKNLPIDVTISFPTVLEILAQFGRQRQYLEKVAASEETASYVKGQLITGEASAEIIEQELLNVKAFIPAPDSYKCLKRFAEHLSAGRITGYGDYFDLGDFKLDLKRGNSHAELRERLLSSKRYHSTDPKNREFRADMDTLHLAMSKYFSDQGLLYTGPKSTRSAFGKNQVKYARTPEVLLGMLHVLNQSASSATEHVEAGAESFLSNAIDFYNESLFALSKVSKTGDFAKHETSLMVGLDKIYRREMYFDRRKKTSQSTDEDMKSVVSDMSASQVRDVHKMASERMASSVNQIQEMLDLEITEDLKEFLSPGGKDYIENIFKGLS